jgi:hypothetical protein
MPVILVVPVALIVVLAVGAFALRHAEGHASELREALFLLLVLAAVSPRRRPERRPAVDGRQRLGLNLEGLSRREAPHDRSRSA